MKTVQRKVITPKQVAIDFIKIDMHQGAIINLFLIRNRFTETDDYAIRIDADNKSVIVTKIYGVHIWEEFPIYWIMQKVLREMADSLTPDTNVFLSDRCRY